MLADKPASSLPIAYVMFVGEKIHARTTNGTSKKLHLAPCRTTCILNYRPACRRLRPGLGEHHAGRHVLVADGDRCLEPTRVRQLFRSRNGFCGGRVVLSTLAVTLTSNIYFYASFAAILAFALVTIRCIARQIVRGNKISANRIVGAISLYLLLGVTWSVAYAAIERFLPGSWTVSQPQGALSGPVSGCISAL